MIVAQEKTGCCKELPGRVSRPRKIRRNKPVPGSSKLALTGMVAAFFLVGMLITYYYSQVLALGYQIGRLEQKIAVLRVENNNIDGEVQRLVSLESIESMAVNKLGMVKPASNDVLVVAVAGKKPQTSASDTKAVEVASISPAEKEKSPLIRAFTELVNRLENKIWLGRGLGSETEEGTNANNKLTDSEKNNRTVSFRDGSTPHADFSSCMASAC